MIKKEIVFINKSKIDRYEMQKLHALIKRKGLNYRFFLRIYG